MAVKNLPLFGLQVIKKKLVRKALDMFKKMEKADYEKFWKEYSTNIKLGVIEDPANRTRLAKLLMFHSSNQSEMTDLAGYVSRMKEKQEHIYYIAGANKKEVIILNRTHRNIEIHLM